MMSPLLRVTLTSSSEPRELCLTLPKSVWVPNVERSSIALNTLATPPGCPAPDPLTGTRLPHHRPVSVDNFVDSPLANTRSNLRCSSPRRGRPRREAQGPRGPEEDGDVVVVVRQVVGAES